MFNLYEGSQNTAFARWMASISGNNSDIAFGSIEPPSVPDLAASFQKPIIVVTMFTGGGTPLLQAKKAEKEVEDLRRQGRTNVTFIHGRRHIDRIGIECSNMQPLTFAILGSCDEESHHHKCIGVYGGHPDLISFDVEEALYQALQGEYNF